ncbi:MAG: class I SAM-dependent RNA methyltransferase [Hyphomicrobiales bacterium]|nr:class I SAM-dependent RNA methyltransferase [Hyphomicrobiales bacterium]MCP5001778.1 class I SAM-dependent RNA methyltransferase [Hyphomicrobiales bacterium]
MSTETVTISSLGAQGDGIAVVDGEPVYVGFALPEETVTIMRNKSKGQLVSVDFPSTERTDPPCPHFGPQGQKCGGCSLQHLELTAYHHWKKQLVAGALAARGIDAQINDLMPCLPGSRRRAVFSVMSTKNDVTLGFNQAGTHTIIGIKECTVLSPVIVDQIGGLRRLAMLLARGTKPFRLNVLATFSGLDVSVEGIASLSEKKRPRVIGAALELGLARLSLGTEILVEARTPVLKISGIDVAPPPAGFLQASEVAQDKMIALVSEHMTGSKRIADLFSGCGTFTLPLARQSAVHAVESDGPALAALDFAARHTQGLKPVTIERRDLFRRPLMAAELKKIDAVVFDPPRAGAQAQSAEIATSSVRKVAAVSCYPATLARDLRTLIDGGFRLLSVTPIDQFLWSPHVEAVALLER